MIGEGAVKYDLSTKILPFLDSHLRLKLLAHVKELKIYDEDSLSRTILSVLESTFLKKESLEIIKGLPGLMSEEESKMDARLKQCSEDLAILQQKCSDLLQLIQDETEIDTLLSEGKFNASFLQDAYGIKSENIEAFFQYGRLFYQSGEYEKSGLILFYYRAICTEQDKLMSSYWGKIAGQILQLQTNENVNSCWTDFKTLEGLVNEKDEDSHTAGAHHLEIMELRSWLLHWSLFLFFKKGIVDDPEAATTVSEGNKLVSAADMPNYLMTTFLDFTTQEKNLNTIQINCPWLLRYMAAACILQKPTKYALRSVLRAIWQEDYTFEDPFTKFLTSLVGEYDFETAALQLRECEKALKLDFFLQPHSEKLIERARSMMFETYCRVHASLDINWLSQQLGLGYNEAERWVVNLIRAARLDGKIDSEKGVVKMNHKIGNPYQRSIDLTKDLAFRTFRLASSLQ